MKFKISALVLAASMFAAPAFADNTDIAAVAAGMFAATDITAFTAANDVVLAASVDLATAAYADSNVALIAQLSDTNFAVVDQLGTNNYAAVAQQTAAFNVAVISQQGIGNRASVNQH